MCPSRAHRLYGWTLGIVEKHALFAVLLSAVCCAILSFRTYLTIKYMPSLRLSNKCPFCPTMMHGTAYINGLVPPLPIRRQPESVCLGLSHVHGGRRRKPRQEVSYPGERRTPAAGVKTRHSPCAASRDEGATPTRVERGRSQRGEGPRPCLHGIGAIRALRGGLHRTVSVTSCMSNITELVFRTTGEMLFPLIFPPPNKSSLYTSLG